MHTYNPIKPLTERSKKKWRNHIPRPPNAFILFRSWVIKNHYVSTEVETSHSTLSKIIGLTWKNLSDAERKTWYAAAQIALEEHRRQFPGYIFRPVHTKVAGATVTRRKKGPTRLTNQKRCEKIAELLACGNTFDNLEKAVQEFDSTHVPEIIIQFEPPLTAFSFKSTMNGNQGGSDVVSISPQVLVLDGSRDGASGRTILTTDSEFLEDLPTQNGPDYFINPQSIDDHIQLPLNYEAPPCPIAHFFPEGPLSNENHIFVPYNMEQVQAQPLSPTLYPSEYPNWYSSLPVEFIDIYTTAANMSGTYPESFSMNTPSNSTSSPFHNSFSYSETTNSRTSEYSWFDPTGADSVESTRNGGPSQYLLNQLLP